MDAAPPELEPPKPRRALPKAFWYSLFTPIALFILAMITSHGAAVALAIFSSLITPFACAIMVGNRSGAGAGVLTFFGVSTLYVALGFVGCGAALSGI